MNQARKTASAAKPKVKSKPKATKPATRSPAAKTARAAASAKTSRRSTAPTAREGSKQAQLIALLKKPSGGTIEEMTTLTGWQPHSVRGVMSGVLRKRLGLNIVSEKDGDERHWRIEAAPAR